MDRLKFKHETLRHEISVLEGKIARLEDEYRQAVGDADDRYAAGRSDEDA